MVEAGDLWGGSGSGSEGRLGFLSFETECLDAVCEGDQSIKVIKLSLVL
jgi:hypothetical protein